MSPWRIVGLWGPVALFMLSVYAFASPRFLAEVPLEWHTEIHIAIYALFGMLCLRAFHGGCATFLRWRPTILAVTLALGYAALDEWNQTRIAGRDASAIDWLADAAGLCVALLVAGAMAGLARRIARDTIPDVSEESEGGG